MAWPQSHRCAVPERPSLGPGTHAHPLTHSPTHRLPAAPRLSGAAHPPEEIGSLPGKGHCANETYERGPRRRSAAARARCRWKGGVGCMGDGWGRRTGRAACAVAASSCRSVTTDRACWRSMFARSVLAQRVGAACWRSACWRSALAQRVGAALSVLAQRASLRFLFVCLFGQQR